MSVKTTIAELPWSRSASTSTRLTSLRIVSICSRSGLRTPFLVPDLLTRHSALNLRSHLLELALQDAGLGTFEPNETRIHDFPLFPD